MKAKKSILSKSDKVLICPEYYNIGPENSIADFEEVLDSYIVHLNRRRAGNGISNDDASLLFWLMKLKVLVKAHPELDMEKHLSVV